MRQLAALAILALVLAPAATARAEQSAPISLLDPASGKTTNLTLGAPVLHVVFFATWCPPCRDELDALTQLRARWDERGYRLVLVAVQTRHTAEKLARFAADNELPGQLLFDHEGAVEARFAATGLPTHLLLDESGQIILRAETVDDVGPVLEDRLAFRPGGDG